MCRRVLVMALAVLTVLPVIGTVLAGERVAELEPRIIDGGAEEDWVGEPISLSLKDADLRDVIRGFAELTDLNIIVDPTVSGSVTVELHEVPWDQAFDLMLRINGLGWTLEGNVVYVAPVPKLPLSSARR